MGSEFIEQNSFNTGILRVFWLHIDRGQPGAAEERHRLDAGDAGGDGDVAQPGASGERLESDAGDRLASDLRWDLERAGGVFWVFRDRDGGSIDHLIGEQPKLLGPERRGAEKEKGKPENPLGDFWVRIHAVGEVSGMNKISGGAGKPSVIHGAKPKQSKESDVRHQM